MQAKMSGHQLVMVLLDSAGGNARSEDAERVRKWVTHTYAIRALGSASVAAPLHVPTTGTGLIAVGLKVAS